MKYAKIYISFIICLTILSCADLDVENLNQADIDRVLEDPDEYAQLVENQFITTWLFSQSANNSLALDHAADGFTGGAVSFNINRWSSEPRLAIENTPLALDATHYLTNPYNDVYRPIGTINDILKALKKDPDIVIENEAGEDISKQVLAQALFIQGLSYGNLSMIFDQGQFVDENTDLQMVSDLPFTNYMELANSAINILDRAVEEANLANDFTVTAYNGVSLNKDEFIRLIKTMQARILVNNARNELENQNTNWTKVLKSASKGITKDLIISAEAWPGKWRDTYKIFSARTPWTYVDYRIISMLDPSQPSRFPQDGSHPLAPASSIDNRLTTDMVYTADIDIKATDGLYRFSHYKFTRYASIASGGSVAPYILKAENDLNWAEALIRTSGSKSTAAQLINNSRVKRGGLSPLDGSENDQDLLNALYYERLIELMGSSGGNLFYTRRRLPADNGNLLPLTGLQSGTFENYPVPAPELILLKKDLYTFGGN
jgi:hypothetical protein